MARLLAYTSPAAGHLFPLVPGLLELRSRGHEVHVRTGAHLVGALRGAGLEAEAAGADGPIDGRDAPSAGPEATATGREATGARPEADVVRRDPQAAGPDATATGGDPAVGRGATRRRRGAGRRRTRGADTPGGELRRQAARAAGDAAALRGAIATVGPDVVLVDLAAWGAAAAAEASGLPWATCNPYLCPLPGPGVPPFGLGLAPRPGLAGRARDAAGWWVVRRAISRAVLPELNTVRAGLGLPPLRDALDQLARPDALLQLSGGALEHLREHPPEHLRLVGLQSWDPAPASADTGVTGTGAPDAGAADDGAAAESRAGVRAGTPAWLVEPGDPWVLVTCSTDGQDDAPLAAAAIEAFRDEPVRVVVTLGAADARGLPSAPNARVEAFVPHGPVLRHASTVVCHGGMGIVGKALRAGTALVVVPYGRDQPEVAGRVVHAGLGARVSPRALSADALRAAYHDALARRDAMREASRALAAADPAGAFADAVEELLGGDAAAVT